MQKKLSSLITFLPKKYTIKQLEKCGLYLRQYFQCTIDCYEIIWYFYFFCIRLQEHICELFFLEPMSSSFPNWTGPKKKGRNKLKDQRLFIY